MIARACAVWLMLGVALAQAQQVTPQNVLEVLVTPPSLPPPAPLVVSFEANSARLTPQAREALGEFLAKVKDRRLQVSGHADAMGSPEYNQRLSKRRAEAVRAYLVGHGVAGEKIELSARGETQPVEACPEQMKRSARRACLAANRRVVVEAL
jgi:OOP family OmpA-OmpF porin